MGSDAGESDTAEPVGDGSNRLLKGTTLAGIQRPKILRRCRSFLYRGLVMSYILKKAIQKGRACV
jgi:hypothetical protein